MSTGAPSPSKRTCDNCGSVVSADYHRVFADGHGTLHSCLHCRHQDGMHAPHHG